MAKLPKDELAIKKFIAKLITDNTSVKQKDLLNVRLKGKSNDFEVNGSLQNSCLISENMIVWTMVRGKPDEDYTKFETAVNEAVSPLFNNLQIVSVRESQPDDNYQRYYEIKVY